MKKLKRKLWKYVSRIKTVRGDLLYLFGIACLIVLLLDLWLFNIPEFWRLGNEFGQIIYKLSFAYITAFMFYFINIHLQSYKSKVKTYRYTHNKISILYTSRLDLIKVIEKASGEKIENVNGYISQLYLDSACKKISSYSQVIFGRNQLQFQNWFTLLDYIEKNNKEVIHDLLLVKENLDSEIIRILTNLENNLDMFLNSNKGVELGNTDLEFISYSVNEYFHLIKVLSDYYREEYKPYQSEYHELEGKRNLEIRKLEEDARLKDTI